MDGVGRAGPQRNPRASEPATSAWLLRDQHGCSVPSLSLSAVGVGDGGGNLPLGGSDSSGSGCALIPPGSAYGLGAVGGTGGLTASVYLPSRGMRSKRALEEGGKPGRIRFPGATVYPLVPLIRFLSSALKALAVGLCQTTYWHFKLNRPGVYFLVGQGPVLPAPLACFSRLLPAVVAARGGVGGWLTLLEPSW